MQEKITVTHGYPDTITGPNLAPDELLRERVLYVLLDRST
tara:strand:+ start:333 stop:452 length:120 start_codon:yes stop_codon:yes gene_type:complete